jgi:hypothetical protein
MFEKFLKFYKDKRGDVKEKKEEESSLLQDFLWALGCYLIISTFFYQNFVIP